MINVGLNGFGRIGRSFFRQNLLNKKYKIVAINDIDPDLDNHAYLLKYDTVYGKLSQHKIEALNNELVVDSNKVKFTSKENINEVDWAGLGAQVVIDCSGVKHNVLKAKGIINESLKKVIVSHAPKEGLDFTLMKGVNEDLYDKDKHHVISSSICDANAVAPIYKLIEESFGIETGYITTLHPWLSYQNLVDGTLRSVSSPGHYWKDYALGRSSLESLIPKNTTLCNALDAVIPNLSEKIDAISYRVPTSIVSSADCSFYLKNNTKLDDVIDVLKTYENKNNDVIKLDDRSLVSVDYKQTDVAAVVDMRWLSIKNEKLLKFVLWYDNEWGYTSRIYNLVSFIME